MFYTVEQLRQLVKDRIVSNERTARLARPPRPDRAPRSGR